MPCRLAVKDVTDIDRRINVFKAESDKETAYLASAPLLVSLPKPPGNAL